MKSWLLCMLLCLTSAAQAQWMLIGQSGARPQRVAVFADVLSLSSSSDNLQLASAIARNDKAEQARLEERARRFKTLRLVELYEAPGQPDSRYYSLELDGDAKTYRLLDAREFRRNATFVDLTSPGWKPADRAAWGQAALKFAFEQEPWRQATRQLLERVSREGATADQRELAGLGYELVNNETDSGFPDLLWKYVWTDGQRPPGQDSDLVVAKINYGLKLAALEEKGRQEVLGTVQRQLAARQAQQKATREVDNSLLGSWLDAPVAELVASWGEPHQFSERNGVRYLTWRKERVVDIMRTPPPSSGIATQKIGEEIYWSEVTFSVSQGRIVEYTTAGNEPW